MGGEERNGEIYFNAFVGARDVPQRRENLFFILFPFSSFVLLFITSRFIFLEVYFLKCAKAKTLEGVSFSWPELKSFWSSLLTPKTRQRLISIPFSLRNLVQLPRVCTSKANAPRKIPKYSSSFLSPLFRCFFFSFIVSFFVYFPPFFLFTFVQ